MNHVGSRLARARYRSRLVGASVEYRVLVPAGWDRSEPLPLVLHLHGAMSSSRSLEAARPVYDELMSSGDLPRALVACPSTPTARGFYLDWPGAAWETLVAEEFPEHLALRWGPFATTAVVGASMGGYGALKVAFTQPARYAAVAAISPAVFPGERPQDVPARTTPSVLGDLHDAMSAGTADPDVYATNTVYGRLRSRAEEIRAASLAVLVDCGADDEFLLHEGAGYLHRVLVELGIPHEYRLVEGAGHLGPQAEARTRDAVRFVGAALRAADASARAALSPRGRARRTR